MRKHAFFGAPGVNANQINQKKERFFQMNEVIMLKYGEIVLKGLNRRRFEEILLRNIKNAVADIATPEVGIAQSTVYVSFSDDYADYSRALDRLSRVFGISALTRAAKGSYDFDQALLQTAEYLRDVLDSADTFKVVAKRADKKYRLNSPQIGALAGEYLLEKFPHLSVDLHNPQVTVFLEVREGNIYIHADAVRGAGGLPAGTSGHGLLMLSGGIDSPVAGYRMARRGMRISAVHFESPPYTSERAKMKVEKLAKKLSVYCGEILLYTVHFTEIQEQIRNTCREDLFTVIMRRFMLRIACNIASSCKATAVITGESLGQVASQTAGAILCTDAVSSLPVFRPLIGSDKQEIIDLSYQIDTFETSIEPYEDCCTVFTPKHPKTSPRLEDVEKEEAKLNIEELVSVVTVTKERIGNG